MPWNFACRCDKKSAKECDKARAWVRSQFPGTEADYDLPTLVVHALSDMGVTVTGMYADQWCGISAENTEGHKVFVQCDQITDGLCFVMRQFHDLAQKK